MQFINRKKFVRAALDLDKEAFVVHMAYLEAKIWIHLAQEAQVGLLLTEKITVPDDYLNYTDIFSKKLAAKLSKCSDIN